ncbi:MULTISPECIES: glycosyltransferase family 4 protein [Vibrio]|uniref:glycosyltransferase family 4 protein n=1 Tax=Vibrio TaxID=662 RepID=UPI00084AE555|nr:glycosyltransferase family 4 protein [Vibrio parahaemolyticus]EIY7830979.1 glycosyltransferase family 4 protein [Vibrio parahaemolyticus]MBO0151990.1 glycosyltransferase family 4 protein [Vibrio parahaemolyticus]MDF5476922.1 glycosyltransferase family 4 protein [Vibrio parahaemolyticus]MDF5488317.1 glycosyltransferase family 4 protein [Vibrio parahaemolyticus]MDF5504846.1 glycosyltransferase family 4 protein [Vibrio parahaemolyticus]
MSVAFFIPRYKNTGPVNVVNSIISSKYFVDNEIYIFSFESEEGVREVTISGKNCVIYSFNKFKPFRNLLKINKLLKKFNIKVVHSHGFYPDFYSCVSKLFLFPAKFITTVHNYPFKDYSQEYGEVSGSLLAYFHLIFIRKLDLVVGCSQSVSNYLDKHSVNSVAVSNGVHLNLPSKVSPKPSKLKLVSIGRVIKRKKPQSFCDYSLTKCDLIDSFTWIGDGDLLPSLMEKYSNVDFTGHIENVSDAINNFDVMVSNSSAEGYPLAVLEFLSHGKPVILSNIEPHVEIKNSIGKGVYIIVDDSFEELKRVLREIQDDDLTFSSSELYPISINHMCEKYENLYDKLL